MKKAVIFTCGVVLGIALSLLISASTLSQAVTIGVNIGFNAANVGKSRMEAIHTGQYILAPITLPTPAR